MFERQREKEKETANTIRESVLNHAIDCRTRETILLSLHCSTRRNSVLRTRKCDDACKIRYFIATIMTAGRYNLFTELDFHSRINVLPSCNVQQYVNSLNYLTNFKEIYRTRGVSVFLHRYDIFIFYIPKHTHIHICLYFYLSFYMQIQENAFIFME